MDTRRIGEVPGSCEVVDSHRRASKRLKRATLIIKDMSILELAKNSGSYISWILRDGIPVLLVAVCLGGPNATAAEGAPTQFWDGSNTVFDGTVHGGSGTWDNFTTNFTNGTAAPNQAWQNGVAVFTAEPGTVTLGADILFQGVRFSSDGYMIAGAGAFALHPTGMATITTDPDVTATIAAPIVGTGGLTIGDGTNNGTVVLSSGVNTYIGGTTVVAATLSVDTDAELGDASGGIILQSGGELLTTANFTSARSVSLNPESLGVDVVTPLEVLVAPNILAAAANTTATYTGVVFGTGGLTIGDGTHNGTVVLSSGANTYFGVSAVESKPASGGRNQNQPLFSFKPLRVILARGELSSRQIQR